MSRIESCEVKVAKEATKIKSEVTTITKEAANFEEKIKQRGKWVSSTDFILASLGNMIGFGNVWRFPSLVFKHGGGVFVIVYIIASLVIGFPIIFIETTLAQYSQSGSGHVFANIAPIFKGVGYCSVTACTMIATYYNVLITWSVFYFIEGFSQKWSHCHQHYNTDRCITIDAAKNYSRSLKHLRNSSEIHEVTAMLQNSTSSAEEFFNRYMLNKTEKLTGLSWPQRGLSISLVASTALAVIGLIRGVEYSRNVVYFTAIYPYVMMIILFLRGITLEGAFTGIKHYVLPKGSINFRELLVDAIVQVFFSIGAGTGNLYTFGSFNKFHTKLVNKMFFITLADLFTALFSGFVVFSMVGFISELLGKSVHQTVKDRTGLIFIVIIEGLTQMPLSYLSIFCFISMLFSLGISSLFGSMETVKTFFYDLAHSKCSVINKTTATLIIGFVLLIGGLPMTSRSGIHILNLMDTFCAGLPVTATAIGDSMIVAFIYGPDKFLKDFQFMTGTTLHPTLKFIFKCVLFLVLPSFVLLMFFNDFISKIFWSVESKIASDSPPYPTWAILAGWLLGTGPIAFIPGFAIHFLMKMKGKTFKERWKAGTTATQLYHTAAMIYGSFENAKKSQEKHKIAKKNNKEYNRNNKEIKDKSK